MISNCTAVVPVRLNSTRIEKKVLQTICIGGVNRSLLVHKLISLKSIFCNVIVSCGESELATIAEEQGCLVSWRDTNFIEAKYKTSTRDSICEVIKDVKTLNTAWCPVVSPFHDSTLIKESYVKFEDVLGAGYDSLTTVHPMQAYFWGANGPINYQADENHVQSQLLNPLYKVSNGLYIAKTATMRQRGYFLGETPYLKEVSFKQAIDIDTIADLELARLYCN